MKTNSLFVGLLSISALAAMLGCATPSEAARLVDVTVVNRATGERLTPYRRNGKLYVAGTPGDRYAIEVRSRQGERVMTVMSVDGVNVVTGQTASASRSGYVLDAWQSYSISGWRKNMNEVAQFVFTSLSDSYAARTGRPDNVGVIGVAVYREKIVPPKPSPWTPPVTTPDEPWRSSGARPTMKEEAARDRADVPVQQRAEAPAPAAPAAKPDGAGFKAGANRSEADTVASAEGRGSDQDSRIMNAYPEQKRKAERLGTGHGEREYSPTQYTEFVRNSSSPDEVITIYYDSRANLVARGIIPSYRYAEPRPFPNGAGFVPDPQG